VSGPPADCQDANPCTDDGCDAATGCTHTPRSECAASCGDVAAAPCSVTVSSSPRRFADLQAAIDATEDGATINVEGTCAGSVTIVRRVGLTVQGVPPGASGCPAEGLAPGDLRSTVRGGGKVIGVRRSRDIEIRFLNIVDAEKGGLQLSEVEGSRATCNCVARNGTAGVTVFGGRDNALRKNLVTLNSGLGIRLRQATENAIVENIVRRNRSGGIGMAEADRNTLERNAVRENAAAGIELDDSNRNVLRENTVAHNAADGLDLETADRNELVGNEVEGSGRDPERDSGIELRQSHRNTVGQNVIRDNADRLTD
jgi:parallel beta-helix repeat protein